MTSMADVARQSLDLPAERRSAYIQQQAVLLTGHRIPAAEVRAALREAVRELSRSCSRARERAPGRP